MELKLAFPQDGPPLAILCAAKVAGVSLTLDPKLASGSAPTLHLGSGDFIHGVNTILRYIARVASVTSFYGQDAIQAAYVDQWLDYAPVILSGSEFEAACSFLNGYLASRTFLVSYGLSIADIVVWSNLAGTGQRWESLRRSKKYQNLVRWFNSIADYSDTLDEVVSAYVGKRGIGKSPAPSLKEKLPDSKQNISTPEVDLPGAKVGEVCVRFAPEPSGYLHIGHAKAGLLNKYFAERYKGRLIVRFDDTNPSKESNEFVENVLKDVETLGIKYDIVTYTSDYFPQLMEMAEKLIKQGKAYVDDTPKEQMRSERMDGVESKCRNNIVEDNLSLWKEMINGTERGMQCCVRGKLDMQDPNKSLRDPVYYRCNTDPHHRVGSKYKVYPTYDFACPFVDALEGVTHALRSSEYHDRNAQYYRILQEMGLRRVEIYEFSRLNMVYTVLSKRKLLWFVQNKKVEDWTDPRFPTVQGIVRRGLKVEALVQFILEQGASKNLNLMEWDKLWTINKKIIDPVCGRHTAILKDQRVLFTLTNGPEEPFIRVLPRHKKYEGAGKKATTFTNKFWLESADASVISIGEEVTLMDWGNAIIKEIKTENGIITELLGELHLEGSVKMTKLKLTWLPDIEDLVSLSLVEFDYLIKKKKLEEDEDFLDNLNPCTRQEFSALGDANMRNLKQGEIIQLERKGYYRCDAPFIRSSKPIVLFAIPDGRQKSATN
ncbi:glutamate--tRNA ligase, cytoplasmic-like [Oryza glaberrima]|uniref:glutamate--tRNA ligase, cytoplasmic-like n=1 Tax=Oryza glaberrima TaxID=4538 RepID=UPI00224BF538|nr:glutamate--tRNA ligase, cytoplasmic-like [Oryza glaberrima]